MSAVLEAPSAFCVHDVELLSPLEAGCPGEGEPAASVDHLLVDCLVCGSTHVPGTETDPGCPVAA